MRGSLAQGVWRLVCYHTSASAGDFRPTEAAFRARVQADSRARFPAAAGRYHLYVSRACPWAHRTLILRRLKQLEDVVSADVVEPLMGDDGWAFAPGADSVNGFAFLREAYVAADPHYSGRVTVPVLWDRQTRTIVNNESAEIIRMLNSAFEAFTDEHTDYYPQALRPEIDAVNDYVYERVNNGVYRCGFAGSQAAYEQAFDTLFDALETLEARLGRSHFLVGERLTEADWRLFTTLVRFDPAYYLHFKCNLKRIADYPNLTRYLRALLAVPGVSATVDLDHIKRHYYQSHRHLNPSGLVPKGPRLDWVP